MKFVAALMLAVFGSFSFAQAQQETHGGDGYAMEFFRVYSELRVEIPEADLKLENGKTFSVRSLDKIRPQLKVVSAPTIIWNGKEVSARNSPSTFLVELSQTHWQKLNYEQKVSLVLHEVLPIAGWIDDDYAISTAILSYMDMQPTQLSIKTIAERLLACDQRVLKFVSKGMYQSFLSDSRADLIHLSIVAGCDYFLAKVIEYSSATEVQTACEDNSGLTPFEALVFYAKGAMLKDAHRYSRIFDLLYSGTDDKKLYCYKDEKLEFKKTVCEVLPKNEELNSALMKEFAMKAGCQ
jgi:hypothetical protein